MKIALIHYWLVNWRGGEQVLKAISDLLPSADIYTHVADQRLVERHFPNKRVRTTFISRLPFARRLYQLYLPLMPLALEELNLQKYDLIISSEAGPAKGVIAAPHAVHICYCHSPMRFVWDRYYDYWSGGNLLKRIATASLLHHLRIWDQVSAQRVDHYIANSRFVSQRIAKYYGRRAHIIYPPVAIDTFDSSQEGGDFYLWVGQLVAYKRPDLLVGAFNELRLPLVIIGEGPLMAKLRSLAKKNIRFLGRQPFNVLRDHYARCRAVVFPGIEDFGMVPVEAMASGRPVIAYDYGGIRETVIRDITGMLFQEPTAESLIGTIKEFERRWRSFDRSSIRAHAEQFSESAFKGKFKDFVSQVISSGKEGGMIEVEGLS